MRSCDSNSIVEASISDRRASTAVILFISKLDIFILDEDISRRYLFVSTLLYLDGTAITSIISRVCWEPKW